MTLHEDILNAYAAFVPECCEEDVSVLPARKGLILACMDARLHPEKVLGLHVGDCHCVRNAGGRASDDAIRSIAISQRLLGTKEVHIIHHTDCGMLTFTNEQLAAKIQEDLGTDAGFGRDFLPFPDLEQSVRDDIATVKTSPLVARDTVVHGYIYNVKTRQLDEVTP